MVDDFIKAVKLDPEAPPHHVALSYSLLTILVYKVLS